jgi:hypothetical protein
LVRRLQRAENAGYLISREALARRQFDALQEVQLVSSAAPLRSKFYELEWRIKTWRNPHARAMSVETTAQITILSGIADFGNHRDNRALCRTFPEPFWGYVSRDRRRWTDRSQRCHDGISNAHGDRARTWRRIPAVMASIFHGPRQQIQPQIEIARARTRDAARGCESALESVEARACSENQNRTSRRQSAPMAKSTSFRSSM